ncbi:MAG TPA: HDOD domain-containing protein [Sedimentisphaerales bacterium]|jgi:putative nucleotidyltransferase with HDIG domain|nr:HDOD domain-containing protein [Sedimentisphaerales bacterium]HNU31727.1 HDOD domain-containing protein [Sedimentisphaerales bacterium]
MAKRYIDATASRKVELAINELDSLSVPPCVAVQYLTKLAQSRFSPASVVETLECEPACAAAILSLAQRRAAGPVPQRHSVRLVLDRLDADDVRDALLQTKVTAGFEIDFADQQLGSPDRKDLILHSVAVAHCARRLAEAAPDVDPQLAWSAGLLHDIGKFALQDVMPKSLAAMAREAEATNLALYRVEHEHLGTNHTLLGRQLAQRWRLPEPIMLAIWLHHRDASALEPVAEARIALLVKAADNMARRAGIGQSGSFDAPDPLVEVGESVGIAVKTLQQIIDDLPAEVKRRSEALGLEIPRATARYCDLIQATAADLARKHTKLSAEGRALAAASGYLGFAQEFLNEVSSSVAAIDLAEEFARRWQRFFQTGTVCICLTACPREGAIDAAVVEALGHSHKTVLEAPAEDSPVPKSLVNQFAVLDAQDRVEWLLEQLEVDFSRGQTKVLPLLSDGQAIGLVVFELSYPADAGLFAERFETAASLAGTILGLALANERRERLAERLSHENGRPRSTASRATPMGNAVEALAEMAAGVAHELNNPLSVITGRAQLIAQAESDGQKRNALEKIVENAREASSLVDDLMAYAQPPAPRVGPSDIRQIIDEAIELARQKTGAEHINAQVQVAQGFMTAMVDSAQIASALANIIANAVESYADTTGPVKIAVEAADTGLILKVSDLGSGMDEATIKKAASPFFSAKPAGRKRGMGLAFASRLVQLNGGTIELESQPDHGTTVTVTLPTA